MIEDLPARYHEYLERSSKELGELTVGAFTKFRGRLVKKLSFEEFTPLFLEHVEIDARYRETLDNGDTLNDLVLRILREQSATLVLPPPVL